MARAQTVSSYSSFAGRGESHGGLKICEVGDFRFHGALVLSGYVLEQHGESDDVDAIEIAAEIVADGDFVSPRAICGR